MTRSSASGAGLAADGGSKVRTEPFPPWPNFEEDEREAALRVLKSGKVNYWTGDEGRHFESELAGFVGRTHGVAVANGTAALELALRACGIGTGDDVLVTSRSFVASATSIVAVGGRPVFADVDPTSQNVTVETLQAARTPDTHALVAVHLGGWPCAMDEIVEWAREIGIVVIEDCAQAMGARYRGRHVGSFGDVAAFSFCQDKIITTAGEGGMVVTNDEGIWRRVWEFKDHGKSHEAVQRRQDLPGFQYVHGSFGTNLRLSEVQSAVGRAQLRKVPRWLEHRRWCAEQLNEAFDGIPALRTPIPPSHVEHAYYRYSVFVRPERLTDGWDRDRIVEAVRAEGIPCYGWSGSEIYLEPCFRDAGLGPSQRRPVAKELGETALMFLVHPTVGQREITETIDAVEKVLDVASR